MVNLVTFWINEIAMNSLIVLEKFWGLVLGCFGVVFFFFL